MSRSALIVVDMLSSYDFADAETLRQSVAESLPAMTGLIDRARAEDVLTVYVNDNYGNWNSDRDELLRTAMAGRAPELVEPIAPRADDLFVVKARHSIFYGTPLEYLLSQEGVDRIVLVGQVTEQCIVYSALDAYIRHLEVCVPRDAVAHIHAHLADASLEMMQLNMSAEICPAAEVVLGAEVASR
ncbi:MAG: Nicotinamidase [uncultured Solirubrobacteraceae bacterium]|uniref:Nicotinamidase n=1 Tax=uncultured Solirubrobacteraceae bacterium TaxID=1162706 RepID=A0A6J4S6C7_9ACTN|nr:MAG: Nicotinamidase [uncultured Solirubrobacteraceae bacterium]